MATDRFLAPMNPAAKKLRRGLRMVTSRDKLLLGVKASLALACRPNSKGTDLRTWWYQESFAEHPGQKLAACPADTVPARSKGIGLPLVRMSSSGPLQSLSLIQTALR
eukprot:717725-Amphidinium_carterae.1